MPGALLLAPLLRGSRSQRENLKLCCLLLFRVCYLGCLSVQVLSSGTEAVLVLALIVLRQRALHLVLMKVLAVYYLVVGEQRVNPYQVLCSSILRRSNCCCPSSCCYSCCCCCLHVCVSSSSWSNVPTQVPTYLPTYLPPYIDTHAYVRNAYMLVDRKVRVRKFLQKDHHHG